MQPEQGALIRTAESNQIEFYHQHFVKGHQKQLELIKRKVRISHDQSIPSSVAVTHAKLSSNLLYV